VIQNAGFGMAFQTMPYLFEQWGSTLAVVAVFAGLIIVFATSSLAMDTLDGIHERRVWLVKNKGAWFWSNDFSFRFTNGYFF
jgi:hypothetical protein